MPQLDVIVAAAVAYAFNWLVAPVMVSRLLRRYQLERVATEDDAGDDGVERGRIIGILERMIVLTLVLVGQWGALGLVIAAKSIARFRNLDNRAFSEYYLIGTLASILIATVSGLLVRLLF
ncbi:MAG: hypothetical protein WD208_03770 [Dehalococcoidia bacterium]